jgi:hypothetical protein
MKKAWEDLNSPEHITGTGYRVQGARCKEKPAAGLISFRLVPWTVYLAPSSMYLAPAFICLDFWIAV